MLAEGCDKSHLFISLVAWHVIPTKNKSTSIDIACTQHVCKVSVDNMLHLGRANFCSRQDDRRFGLIVPIVSLVHAVCML